MENKHKIAIPYFSGSGHTRKLADFISQGASTLKGVSAQLINVENTATIKWSLLHEADAIIFGSPTYMGNVSGQMKLFMDASSEFWIDQKWANKVAAGFTIGTCPSGDQLNSLIQMSVFAAQHGMIWVGQNNIGSRFTDDGLGINESGSSLGLMATSSPDKSKLVSDSDALTARLFGERVAAATQRWNK